MFRTVAKRMEWKKHFHCNKDPIIYKYKMTVSECFAQHLESKIKKINRRNLESMEFNKICFCETFLSISLNSEICILKGSYLQSHMKTVKVDIQH